MLVVGERMITRSTFKRTLEESSSDVNNNKQQQNQLPPKGKKQKKMKSLKNDDGKKKEYRSGRKLFLNHRPFTFQERMDYNRRAKQTFAYVQGFDVGDVPDNINCLHMPIRPYYVPDKPGVLAAIERLKIVENYSKLAIDKYNDDNETKYQFGKVLKANIRGCWSKNFYVTCQSKHVPGSRPKKFQFIVNVYNDVPKVSECRRAT